VKHLITFAIGAMTAWTATTSYHLAYDDARVEHWQRECDAAHDRRGRAEAEARVSREAELAARVELDAVRRNFFDLRNNWHAAPASRPSNDFIPAQTLDPGR